MREKSELVEPITVRRGPIPRVADDEPRGPSVRTADTLTPSAVARLQRSAGNVAVSRLVTDGYAVQRQTRSKYTLEQMVRELEPRERESSKAYLNRLYSKHQSTGLDAEDKAVLETFALSWWDDVLSDVIAEKEAARKKAAAEEERARRFAPVRNAAFTTLDADAETGFYQVVRTAAAKTKTRDATAEKDFAMTYSDGKDVATAVEEAIAGLDLTASNNQVHSRHDFQDSRAAIVNLQVQLGGTAGNFRKGKGDSSSTLVVIDAALWADMMRADAARWRRVIQAAHRESFANGTGVYLNPGRL